MIVETSLNTLINSTNSIDTDDRQHIANQVQFKAGFEASSTNDSIIFQGTTTHDYTVRLKFPVTVVDDANPTGVDVVLVGGDAVRIEQIQPNADVLVSCTCEDFVYRFATTDAAQGVLFGDIRKVSIPKTDRKTQNLGKIGLCKHLIKFTTLLKSERILR